MSGTIMGMTVIALALLLVPCGSVMSMSTATPLCNVEEDSSQRSLFTIRGVQMSDLVWADIKIVMMAGWGNFTYWLTDNILLSNGDNVTVPFISNGLYCNVTDRAGDGIFSIGDFFTIPYVLTAPANSAPTSLMILWVPTAEAMWKGQFENGTIPYEAWPPNMMETSTPIPWLLIAVVVGTIVAAVALSIVLIGRRKDG